MARINVEQEALTDPRFKVLGLQLGAPEEYAHGVGLYHSMQVWSYCLQRSCYVVPANVLDAIQPALSEALQIADLATKNHHGLRIKGTKGRIEWLNKLRESNRNRQRVTRQRHALVTRDNPGVLTPALVLSPAPTQNLSEKNTSSDSAPPNADRARVPVRAPERKAKPSALVSGERIKRLEENFSTLYEFYPKHVGKEAAWRAFIKLDPDSDTLHVIAKDIKRRVDSGEWMPNDPERVQYITHMSTYLNQRRWTDER